MAAIFIRGHPYIWCTTVRHDKPQVCWELLLLSNTERKSYVCVLMYTHPTGFYYSNSVWERDHTKVDLTSAENGPAMAGPAGPIPAPMLYGEACSHSWCILSFSSSKCRQQDSGNETTGENLFHASQE